MFAVTKAIDDKLLSKLRPLVSSFSNENQWAALMRLAANNRPPRTEYERAARPTHTYRDRSSFFSVRSTASEKADKAASVAKEVRRYEAEFKAKRVGD